MFDRRRFLMTAAAGAALAGVSGQGALARQTASDPAVAAAANDLYERIFQQALSASPEGLTSLGLDRTPEFAWARSRLDDRTEAEILRQAEISRGFMAELNAIDRSRLSGMDAINYDTVKFTGDTNEEGLRFPYGSRGFPQAYVVNQLSSAYINLPDFLDSQHGIETAADADAFLARVEAYGAALDQETERAVTDAGRGAAPPDFVIDKALLSCAMSARRPRPSRFSPAPWPAAARRRGWTPATLSAPPASSNRPSIPRWIARSPRSRPCGPARPTTRACGGCRTARPITTGA